MTLFISFGIIVISDMFLDKNYGRIWYNINFTIVNKLIVKQLLQLQNTA